MSRGPSVPGRSPAGRLWTRLEPVRRRVRARVAVDTRALAAFRIALALVILVDLLHRAQHIRLFYTDEGAYPVAAYEATYSQYTGYSIHALSGDPWFQQLLFLVAGLFALAFLVGYRTRLVGLVSLVLLFSLHARNPAVLNGADRLFRVLLVVGLLAPLGERWSVDALRRRSARSRVASFGTAALLLQPVVVLSANAVLKHEGETWYAGDALEIAMLNDSMRYLLGNLLVEYPGLMTALNYGWIVLLAGSSLLLLGTVGRLRALAALAYIGAFVGMLLTMSVGLFPLLLIASVLPFLTAPFWDTLGGRLPARGTGWCPDRSWLGPLARPPLERRLLGWLRDRGHGTLAAYPRALLTVLSAAMVVWIVLFAAFDVTETEPPEPLDHSLLDEQDWGLYAPDPSEGYTWYVTEAQLSDGRAVDAVSGGPAEFDRPPDASAAYRTFRHRKFMRLVDDSGRAETTPLVARAYADWACDRAAARHDADPERVTVYRFYQQSPLDGSYEEPFRSTVIDRAC